jgi:hypothetical protein
MPKLTVSAAASLSANGANPIKVATLTVMVTDASGAARKGLVQADFTVQALQDQIPVGVSVTFENAPYFDPSDQQYFPAYPPGIYFLWVSKSNGTGFDMTSPWTFIVHVYRQVYFGRFHRDFEGWAVAGAIYASRPVQP